MKQLRQEVIDQIPDRGGLFEVADMMFLQALNITTEEMDFMAENASEEEIETFVKFEGTFTEKRKSLEVRNKYIKLYKEKYGS